jgi:hypothetical protein
MPAKVTTQAFPGTFPDGAAMSALLQNAVIWKKSVSRTTRKEDRISDS